MPYCQRAVVAVWFACNSSDYLGHVLLYLRNYSKKHFLLGQIAKLLAGH